MTAETLAAVRALLEELGALEAKATKGPWHVNVDDAMKVHGSPRIHDMRFDGFVCRMWKAHPDKHANARLIVALRNALPRLRALVGAG